jgi:hypothetical protein
MSRFSNYLDEYPGILPGDIAKPDLSEFEYDTDRGRMFERFLALQQNPEGLFMSKIKLPARFNQFMSLGNQ